MFEGRPRFPLCDRERPGPLARHREHRQAKSTPHHYATALMNHSLFAEKPGRLACKTGRHPFIDRMPYRFRARSFAGSGGSREAREAVRTTRAILCCAPKTSAVQRWGIAPGLSPWPPTWRKPEPAGGAAPAGRAPADRPAVGAVRCRTAPASAGAVRQRNARTPRVLPCRRLFTTLLLLRSALFKTLRSDLFESRQVAKSAFARQAECGKLAAFGLPAQCFLNTPRRNIPLFPSNTDGHHTRVPLVVEQLGCRSRPDQCMEARNRTAGDGDEDERKQASRPRRRGDHRSRRWPMPSRANSTRKPNRHRTTNSISASPGKRRTRTSRSASVGTVCTLGRPGGLVGHRGDPGPSSCCNSGEVFRLGRHAFSE